jgi:hypothetical protein
MNESDAREHERDLAMIRAILKLHSPERRGALLADALGEWLASHRATPQVRDALLQFQVEQIVRFERYYDDAFLKARN